MLRFMARHPWSNVPFPAIPSTKSQHLPQIKPQRKSETRCRFRYASFIILRRASWYYWGKDAKLRTLPKPKFVCVLINACGNFQLMNVIHHLFSSGLIWFWMKAVEKLLPSSPAAKSGHRWKDTEFLTNFKSTGKQVDKVLFLTVKRIRNTLKSYLFNQNLLNLNFKHVYHILCSFGSTSGISVSNLKS